MSGSDDVQEGPPSRLGLEGEGRDIVDPDGRKADWDRVVAMFAFHKPDEDQAARMELLRIRARVLMWGIFGSCPVGLERAAAVERLREAIMWANASIVLEGRDRG